MTWVDLHEAVIIPNPLRRHIRRVWSSHVSYLPMPNIWSEYLHFAAQRLDQNVDFILFKRPLTTFGEEKVDHGELEEAETKLYRQSVNIPIWNTPQRFVSTATSQQSKSVKVARLFFFATQHPNFERLILHCLSSVRQAASHIYYRCNELSKKVDLIDIGVIWNFGFFLETQSDSINDLL